MPWYLFPGNHFSLHVESHGLNFRSHCLVVLLWPTEPSLSPAMEILIALSV